MSKVKIFFLAASIIGLFSVIGCSKSSSSTPASTSDSVYSSAWITLTVPFNSADSLYEQTVSAPAITSSIINQGVVLGYGGYLNSNSDTVIEAAIEFDIYQTISIGSIFLQSEYNNYDLWYRYVVVPGNVLATTKLTPQELKSMSYAEVTKILSTAAKKSDPTTF